MTHDRQTTGIAFIYMEQHKSSRSAGEMGLADILVSIELLTAPHF
jgi:hypothetical protein